MWPIEIERVDGLFSGTMLSRTYREFVVLTHEAHEEVGHPAGPVKQKERILHLTFTIRSLLSQLSH